LLKLIQFPPNDAFGKREAVALAQTLAAMGFGVEPDVRFSGSVPTPETNLYLFPLPATAASAPTPAYSAATLLIHLAALVSAADGTIGRDEEEHLERHVAAALHLSEDERLRLDAHRRWVMAERPGLTGVKKRIENLALSQREAIGRFLIGVAGADGSISPEELESLGKLYRMLGLNPQDVYSDAHEAATEPVTVGPTEAAAAGFALPPRRKPAPASRVQLDAAAIEAKLQETAAVSALLAAVFVEDEAQPAVPVAGDGCIAGLDSASSAFLELLASRTAWSRGELELMASERAILLDGVIEAINETAFDRCDEAALEGDDPVEVNVSVLTTLIQRTVSA
jgi:tellurite resistance protein